MVIFHSFVSLPEDSSCLFMFHSYVSLPNVWNHTFLLYKLYSSCSFGILHQENTEFFNPRSPQRRASKSRSQFDQLGHDMILFCFWPVRRKPRDFAGFYADVMGISETNLKKSMIQSQCFNRFQPSWANHWDLMVIWWDFKRFYDRLGSLPSGKHTKSYWKWPLK